MKNKNPPQQEQPTSSEQIGREEYSQTKDEDLTKDWKVSSKTSTDP